MRKFCLFITCLLAYPSFAQQKGNFTDPRDGQQYETIVVGGKIWLRQNLRFKTANSYCPNFNKDSMACDRGNYYLNTEADKVCPPGWNLPTIEDWQAYIDELIRLQRLHKDSMKKTLIPPPNTSTVYEISGFNILNDTLLNFLPTGWIEGNKPANPKSGSIWISDLQTHDNKYHIHLHVKGFVIHTHTHHVIDKPRRIRKFTLRCVCSLNGNGS